MKKAIKVIEVNKPSIGALERYKQILYEVAQK